MWHRIRKFISYKMVLIVSSNVIQINILRICIISRDIAKSTTPERVDCDICAQQQCTLRYANRRRPSIYENSRIQCQAIRMDLIVLLFLSDSMSQSGVLFIRISKNVNSRIVVWTIRGSLISFIQQSGETEQKQSYSTNPIDLETVINEYSRV